MFVVATFIHHIAGGFLRVIHEVDGVVAVVRDAIAGPGLLDCLDRELLRSQLHCKRVVDRVIGIRHVGCILCDE